ncbi:uncharacterized protein LOC129731758 [Wyeomyia smithii]|uniref:uncharacterized protein LOC129731758 n=1 Tax=Wyeomyia smithii TaxID=174621 RepID=UPI002467F677|nr:uncharacterized protein LOC129731758 [Wyeomyia smithii]
MEGFSCPIQLLIDAAEEIDEGASENAHSAPNVCLSISESQRCHSTCSHKNNHKSCSCRRTVSKFHSSRRINCNCHYKCRNRSTTTCESSREFLTNRSIYSSFFREYAQGRPDGICTHNRTCCKQGTTACECSRDFSPDQSTYSSSYRAHSHYRTDCSRSRSCFRSSGNTYHYRAECNRSPSRSSRVKYGYIELDHCYASRNTTKKSFKDVGTSPLNRSVASSRAAFSQQSSLCRDDLPRRNATDVSTSPNDKVFGSLLKDIKVIPAIGNYTSEYTDRVPLYELKNGLTPNSKQTKLLPTHVSTMECSIERKFESSLNISKTPSFSRVITSTPRVKRIRRNNSTDVALNSSNVVGGSRTKQENLVALDLCTKTTRISQNVDVDNFADVLINVEEPLDLSKHADNKLADYFATWSVDLGGLILHDDQKEDHLFLNNLTIYEYFEKYNELSDVEGNENDVTGKLRDDDYELSDAEDVQRGVEGNISDSEYELSDNDFSDGEDECDNGESVLSDVDGGNKDDENIFSCSTKDTYPAKDDDCIDVLDKERLIKKTKQSEANHQKPPKRPCIYQR